MDKKTAIYIRVSTDAQREEGYSIDAQKESLTAFCVSKSFKNYDYYIDGGYTGSNMDRPELQRLINDVKNNQIDRVLVYKLDRLSRSQKDTLYIIEDILNPHEVDFVSLSENMDTSTPLGRLMLGILSAFAQLERENIRERTRMGMKERVKSGLWMGGGNIPYGYDYDANLGIIKPNQDAETVKRIYELYLDGYSTARIARILGFKYERVVLQILSRKSNAGYIVYNGEEYLGQHEAIISLETYQKTMDAMLARSKKPVSCGDYLLTGLIFCGKCGAKMRYQKWGKAGIKLVCYSSDHSKPHLVKDPNCDNLKPWADKIEEVVINDLFSFQFKKSNVKYEVSKENVIDILNKQYDDTAKKIKRLYNLYAEQNDELLLETIDEQKQNLKDIQEQIIAENEKNIITNKIFNAQAKLENIKDAWEYLTQKERKDIIRTVLDKVVITNEKIEVFYKFDNYIKKT